MVGVRITLVLDTLSHQPTLSHLPTGVVVRTPAPVEKGDPGGARAWLNRVDPSLGPNKRRNTTTFGICGSCWAGARTSTTSLAITPRLAIVELTIDPQRLRLRRFPTGELTASEIGAVRAILDGAFGTDEEERFTDDDWDHAVGGVHFVLELDGAIAAHASVVEREIHVGARPFRTGYVEAVATATDRQGRGLGSLLVTDVTAWIRDRFELGALGTGRHHFYERLGWETWRGPSSVSAPDGLRRTPDEDGYILVLRTPTSTPFAVTEPISCDWRAGDVW